MNPEGTSLKVWEHDDTHSHPRPGGGGLTATEEEELDG